MALGKGDYVIMWDYKKMLQYPINIKTPDPRLAKVIISQYGGPDGEIGASLRYLSQRFGMPDQNAKAILNDIGTEELAHLEMVGTLVKQLTDGASISELENAGLSPYYTDHGTGVYPQSSAGVPFDAMSFAVKGDPIADLQEDLAAEQKARATYEKLIDLCRDNADVIDVLKFLREREVVHFQRFGEALRGVQEKLAQKKFYMNNCDNMNISSNTANASNTINNMTANMNNNFINSNMNYNNVNNCSC
jgi:spore coat protein JC